MDRLAPLLFDPARARILRLLTSGSLGFFVGLFLPLANGEIGGGNSGVSVVHNFPAQDEHKHVNFSEFYASYLRQHSNRTSRRLHFIGSTLALASLVALVWTRRPFWFLVALACGYGFAWVGHFAFEKNRPAAFRQPVYSFIGDWKMYWQILTRQIPL